MIAFAAYFSLLGRIGAGAAAYSTLLFPLVALTISTIYEGYQWHFNAVLGLCLILLGNLVMFAAGAEMATGGYLKTKFNPLKPLANIVIIRVC